jgi:hypothetical protein
LPLDVFPFVVEVLVQRALAILALVVIGGVAIAEVHIVSPFTARSSEDPGWRRTSQGWIKVGPLGDAAFVQPEREPITRGALHPLVLTVFVALASLAALVSHDGAAKTGSPPGNEMLVPICHRPHFSREMAAR